MYRYHYTFGHDADFIMLVKHPHYANDTIVSYWMIPGTWMED
jgi:inorganic pyrophosphatase